MTDWKTLTKEELEKKLIESGKFLSNVMVRRIVVGMPIEKIEFHAKTDWGIE